MSSLDNILLSIESYPHKISALLITATVLFLGFAIIDYFRKTKVQLFYKSSLLQQFVDGAASLASRRFYPFPLLSFGLGQCILAGFNYEKSKDLVHTSDFFDYPQGGKGRIDWIDYKSKKVDYKENPIVFVIPGLCSKPDAPYLHDLCKVCLDNGFRTVMFVPRINDTKFLLPETGHFNLVTDIHDGVLHAKKKYPNAKFIGVGHSYGANAIVNYLSTYKDNNDFVAGVSIANPYDFVKSSDVIEGSVIERFLLSGLMNLVKTSIEEVTKRHSFYKYTIEDIFKAKGLRKFDDEFTAKVMGYKDSHEYYSTVGSAKRAIDAKVPLMSINSEDDPFIHYGGVPTQASEKNENLLFVVTKRGAHIGWVHGIFRLKRWYLGVTMDFIKFIAKA